jgi:hypothetical protein
MTNDTAPPGIDWSRCGQPLPPEVAQAFRQQWRDVALRLCLWYGIPPRFAAQVAELVEDIGDEELLAAQIQYIERGEEG